MEAIYNHKGNRIRWKDKKGNTASAIITKMICFTELPTVWD